MAYPYQIHEEAHEEYIGAYNWYELQKPGLGDSLWIVLKEN